MSGDGFRVCETRCDGCLFGRTPIVDDARRRQVLRQLKHEDTHFICHLHTAHDGADVQCRGDYDRDPMRTNLMRIAHRLGVVRFVPAPEQGDA